VIAFRFLRTVLGWAWIFADTMVSATAIGISGETGFPSACSAPGPAASCASPERG